MLNDSGENSIGTYAISTKADGRPTHTSLKKK